ncbi:MAG: AI-2E family transporter [Bacteroidales bacterium]|jgi:predicted PurR-regulated permease PerM|nr:AI-2E family transporter [Bacteroidales bacterium]
MKINIYIVLRVLLISTVVLLGWYFSDILLYLFFAFIFSLIGRPIARKISSVRIYKYRISYGIGTLCTMLLFILLLSLVMLILIPMLVGEMQTLAHVNYDELAVSLKIFLNDIQQFLHQNRMIDPNETVMDILTSEIKRFVSFTSFSNILSGFLSVTSSILFALFCILFFSFFFIKDDFSLEDIAMFVFGKQNLVNVKEISQKISYLLSRYFIGLTLEVFCMIVLIYVGLIIFGIKGALLFAVFGGILNIVPYLGPITGTATCCLFGMIDCVSINEFQAVLPTVVKIAGVFIVANLIDNLLLQPFIYSQSLKTHPVEIFIVLIMGGTLAGIIGMIIAIPVYMIIRTVTVELIGFMNTKQTNN